MPTQFVLSQGGSRSDLLRDGALSYSSRQGLAASSALLIEALPKRCDGRILTGLDRDGAVALAAGALFGAASVQDHHFDAWMAARAQACFDANGASLHAEAAADLPTGPFSVIALPFEARADSLLARDLIEAAHDALAPQGRLIAATDAGHRWLLEAVEHVFRKAELLLIPGRQGAVVLARRTSDAARLRCRRHTVSVPHGENTFSIVTRPGVFSHARLDRGTSALLRHAPVLHSGGILDLGCGAGALGIAVSAPPGTGLVLVDSNARAVALAQENLVAQGRGAGVALLRRDLEDLPAEPCTLALANPPYFGGGRIAESFAMTAAQKLTDDGTLLMVAKDVERHQAILQRCFAEIRPVMVDDYCVFEARRPLRG